MKRRLLIGLVLLVTAALAAGWAWWAYELRWRPKVVDRHQLEIVRALESAGWVSPGDHTGRPFYMVAYAGCAPCERFREQHFAALQAAGVDTRVVMIARPDVNALAQSTPLERATVAQLWLTRDWDLLKAWDAAPPGSWAAPGVPPADGDPARTAIIEAGRKTANDLQPLLKANGVEFDYPVLVWWDQTGRMRGRGADRPESWDDVLEDLGVSSSG